MELTSICRIFPISLNLWARGKRARATEKGTLCCVLNWVRASAQHTHNHSDHRCLIHIIVRMFWLWPFRVVEIETNIFSRIQARILIECVICKSQNVCIVIETETRKKKLQTLWAVIIFFFLNGNSMKITTSNSNKNSGVIINTSKTTTTTTETSKKKDEERRITRLISVKIYEWKFPCDVYILSIRFALNWPVFLVSFTSIWMHTQEIATTVQFLFVCMFTAAQSIDWLYRNPASDLITLWDGCNSVILWERFDLICWFDLNTASFGCFKGNAWWRQQLVLRENQNAISFFFDSFTDGKQNHLCQFILPILVKFRRIISSHWNIIIFFHKKYVVFAFLWSRPTRWNGRNWKRGRFSGIVRNILWAWRQRLTRPKWNTL